MRLLAMISSAIMVIVGTFCVATVSYTHLAAMKSVVSPNTYIILLLLMRIILKPPYK